MKSDLHEFVTLYIFFFSNFPSLLPIRSELEIQLKSLPTVPLLLRRLALTRAK